MFCTNCGAKIADDALFCTNCGTKCIRETNEVVQEQPVVSQVQTEAPQMQEVKADKPKKHTGLIIAIILIVLVVVAAAAAAGIGVLYFMNNKLNKQKEEIVATIGTYELPKYNEEKDEISEKWAELGLFAIEDKKEFIEDLEDLSEDAAKDREELDGYQEELTKATEAKDSYDFIEDFSAFDTYLSSFEEAIKDGDIESAKSYAEQANDMLEDLSVENRNYAYDIYDSYYYIDMSIADASEKDAYYEQLTKIDELFAEENYEALETAFEEMDAIVYPYIEPENPLEVLVQQIDVSEFPNIKVYTRIEEESTGEVPATLDPAMFFIKKKDANGDYIKQEISKAEQLDESGSLMIDIVADVSGSMEGSYMEEAQDAMANFVNSVQFATGDMVELTSFSSGVKIEEEFCSDAAVLVNDIYSLQTDDMTSLYDALYTAVIRVAAQPGAKCVIAFTDGYDNYSNSTYSEVIEVAQRYHVPIFVIGIGYVDEYEIEEITSQTGGEFYNTMDITSMNEIYEEIYKAEKELYVIEYKDDESGEFMDETDILVGYHSEEYGGNDEFTYVPNILLSVDGPAFYEDGPEAVVEAYMEGFDDAMTYSDFSYISDYLLEDSNIYKSQEKYVTRDITETLDSYEIVSVDYYGSDECIVTTRETYYVQMAGEPLQLLTQECQYIVIKDNDKWKLTDFAAPVEVLLRINQ